jgi:ribosomal protein S12
MKYLRIKRMETVGRMAANFLRKKDSCLLQKLFRLTAHVPFMKQYKSEYFNILRNCSIKEVSGIYYTIINSNLLIFKSKLQREKCSSIWQSGQHLSIC